MVRLTNADAAPPPPDCWHALLTRRIDSTARVQQPVNPLKAALPYIYRSPPSTAAALTPPALTRSALSR